MYRIRMKMNNSQSLIRILIRCVIVIVSVSCAAPKQTTDSRLDKAIAESDKNKTEKLDFLKEEKLTGVDSAALITGTEDAEIPPTIPARYRIQLFSGTSANARKLYQLYIATTNSTDIYVVYDAPSGTWKVWAGNYQTKPEADSAKQRFIAAGFADAWVREMSEEQNAALQTKTSDVSLFWVQLGSFQKENSAQQMMQKLRSDLKDQIIMKTVGTTYKIWVGGFTDRKQAETLRDKLRSMGYTDGFIVQGQE